jgi:hypothetical protein
MASSGKLLFDGKVQGKGSRHPSPLPHLIPSLLLSAESSSRNKSVSLELIPGAQLLAS